jgi:hypothetical protein
MPIDEKLPIERDKFLLDITENINNESEDEEYSE